MTTTHHIFVLLNALFFLFYGLQSLISKLMIEEFKRFGMTPSQRILTGILQILGATGLVAGLFFPIIGLLSATGFSVMMSVAFIVRVKIKDNLAQSAPSLIFMVINIWLMTSFIDYLD